MCVFVSLETTINLSKSIFCLLMHFAAVFDTEFIDVIPKPTNTIFFRQWAPTTEGYTSRNHLSCFIKHDNLCFEIAKITLKNQKFPIIIILHTRNTLYIAWRNKETVILFSFLHRFARQSSYTHAKYSCAIIHGKNEV